MPGNALHSPFSSAPSHTANISGSACGCYRKLPLLAARARSFSKLLSSGRPQLFGVRASVALDLIAPVTGLFVVLDAHRCHTGHNSIPSLRVVVSFTPSPLLSLALVVPLAFCTSALGPLGVRLHPHQLGRRRRTTSKNAHTHRDDKTL